MTTGKTLIRSDVSAEPRFFVDDVMLQMGIRSSIVVPLLDKGCVFGSLSLRSRRVGAYGPREQTVLERLARIISPSIHKDSLPGHPQLLQNGGTSSGGNGAKDSGFEATGSDLEDSSNRVEHLSSMQREVLRLVAEGNNYADVARTLYISPNTVKFHMRSVLRKLKAQNRLQAILAWKAWTA